MPAATRRNLDLLTDATLEISRLIIAAETVADGLYLEGLDDVADSAIGHAIEALDDARRTLATVRGETIDEYHAERAETLARELACEIPY